MTEAIQLDPKSGLKTFHTRAAKATDKIAGKGYSVVTDETLKAMPELDAVSVWCTGGLSSCCVRMGGCVSADAPDRRR